MKRENLEGLTDEQKDLVMKLYGKSIQDKDKEIEAIKVQLEEFKTKVATYETKLNEFNESSKDNEEWKAKYEELQASIAEQEEKNKAEEQEKLLTNNILEVFGDRKFTSEYAKNGLLADIKLEVNKPENQGKGIKDIFDVLTKDKTDIFVNPNQLQDMPGMGESEETKNIKEIPLVW